MFSAERRKLLASLLQGSLRWFAGCILAGVALTVCELLVPQVIVLCVDTAVGGAAPAAGTIAAFIYALLGGRVTARALALGLLALGAVSALCRYLAHALNARAGETLVKTLRDRLYAHIQKLPWSWHQSNATGDIIQRCTSDVEIIKTFFQQQFVSVFRIVVLILMAMSFMLSMNPRLSLIAVIFTPIVVAYSLYFHRRIRERFEICDENEGILSTIAQENLTGVRVVRAFGREEFERRRFETQNQLYTEYWMELCRTLARFWSVCDVSSGVQVLLVVVLGAVMCVRGSLTAGEYIAFISYNFMLLWPVRRLGRMIAEMSKAGVSVDRISAILSAEPERDAVNAAEAPMDGDIRFEHVSFRYGEGPEVLRDLSFTIPAGKSFGILGGTGSGKSSLIHLLCRLYAPTEGRITVGGTDIAAMPAEWVRRNVGVVLQEPFLFSRSIGENIGICGADAEEIRRAAVTACIAGDVDDMTQGFDTLVGERGVTLSGGQKQRVAMARTLTLHTPVLIFDDSLSAVDTETDAAIREGLARRTEGTTTVIISHRITTLLDCDTVLVLDRGELSELGTPAELYARGGIYRRIYDIQMDGEEAEA